MYADKKTVNTRIYCSMYDVIPYLYCFQWLSIHFHENVKVKHNSGP